ncbi:RCC1 domain-containing protein [Paenibacillus ginsengarvi]|uniref:RCC1-like domain-containing protein n=1 Tax=Paenibacillus ginsengarvi TaxID=400777 RepID=A0A3B0BLV9_9BACL|nr:hypothetical protein [Paenibacillus ginsengarvi]RKN73029.1 hypothetical protein D7M11_28180 [Paenibacillus ginsengarvi]
MRNVIKNARTAALTIILASGCFSSYAWAKETGITENGAAKPKAQQIEAAHHEATMLDDQGNVWYWGSMYKWFNGGMFPSPGIPQTVPGLDKVTHVSYGMLDALAVKEDGTVWSWGRGTVHKEDGVSGSYLLEALKIPKLDNIIKVSSSHYLNAALDKGGKLWIWGLPVSEKGRSTDDLEPKVVEKLDKIIDMAQSQQNNLTVLKEDGTVWTWDLKEKRGLEIPFVLSNSPTKVEGLTDVLKITSGANTQHQLALKKDGTVWAWGYNFYGQLGQEPNTGLNLETRTFARVDVPVQIDGLTDIIDISAGFDHSLALKKDGTVWLWGSLVESEKDSLPSRSQYTLPVQVKGLSDIRSVSSGNQFDAAIKEDGTVYMWGKNGLGQLGDGTDTFRADPTKVVFP